MNKRKIQISAFLLTEGASLLGRTEKGTVLALNADGGGIDLTEFITGDTRYLSFYLEALADHCAPFGLYLYEGTEMVFEIRLGVLSRVAAPVCIDACWLDGQELFPEANAGELKIVCHGGRVDRKKITRAEFRSLPSFYNLSVKISDPVMLDEYPDTFSLPEEKLVDEFGQNKRKEWPGKIRDRKTLALLL